MLKQILFLCWDFRDYFYFILQSSVNQFGAMEKPHSGAIMSSPCCHWATKESKNCFQSFEGLPKSLPENIKSIIFIGWWVVNKMKYKTLLAQNKPLH